MCRPRCDGRCTSATAGAARSSATKDGSADFFAGATGGAGNTNGPALSARFNDPAGIVYDRNGMFIADYSNALVRAVEPLPTPAASSTW